jgi:hypothetical protein
MEESMVSSLNIINSSIEMSIKEHSNQLALKLTKRINQILPSNDKKEQDFLCIIMKIPYENLQSLHGLILNGQNRQAETKIEISTFVPFSPDEVRKIWNLMNKLKVPKVLDKANIDTDINRLTNVKNETLKTIILDTQRKIYDLLEDKLNMEVSTNQMITVLENEKLHVQTAADLKITVLENDKLEMES